jgi:dienelactone hydrolase
MPRGIIPLLAALALTTATPALAQTFVISPKGDVLQGKPVSVQVTGLPPGATVEIVAERRFGRPQAIWRSSASFKADARGRIDLARSKAFDGSYEGFDAAGLFWSMAPTQTPPAADWKSGDVRFTATVDGQAVATGATRLIGGPATVTAQDIPGFPAAVLYRLPGGKPRPVVVILHGAEGNTQASDRFGRKLAALGYAVVGLPYYSPDWGEYGPPKAIKEIPGSFVDIRVDQLAELKARLAKTPGVDVNRFALFGGSKGAEFALIAASKYLWITSVVAVAPSDLVWEGWGLETVEAQGARSSFSFGGKPLPFMPYVGFVEGLQQGDKADLRKIHEDGRAKYPEREADARIRTEDYRGRLMLIAGGEDRLWESARMAANIEAVRAKAGLKTTTLIYPDAGHDVGGDGWAPTFGEIARGGGTAKANAQAQLDAWPKMVKFLAETLKP